MIQNIINTFKPPSHADLAWAELENAKRQLLEAQSGAEYAMKMAEYHQARIDRLTKYLKGPQCTDSFATPQPRASLA